MPGQIHAFLCDEAVLGTAHDVRQSDAHELFGVELHDID
jgi:hypothetical protein